MKMIFNKILDLTEIAFFVLDWINQEIKYTTTTYSSTNIKELCSHNLMNLILQWRTDE